MKRLRLQLARLRHMQFGRSSERLAAEADQLELALEELETEAPTPPPIEDPADTTDKPGRRKPARRLLPEHLPREVVEHGAGAQACAACGGTLRRLGEDVTGSTHALNLDYLPGRFRVLRHVRPKFSCRGCKAVSQGPAPRLPIRRGRPRRDCSSMSWWPSMLTTCRYTGRVNRAGFGGCWEV
jgi:transposase